jgi:hypothetical protein
VDRFNWMRRGGEKVIKDGVINTMTKIGLNDKENYRAEMRELWAYGNVCKQ